MHSPPWPHRRHQHFLFYGHKLYPLFLPFMDLAAALAGVHLAGGDGRVVLEVSGLDGGPLVPVSPLASRLRRVPRVPENIPLNPNTHGEQNGANSHDLPAHALALVHLRLGAPVEELNNVLGHLGSGGRGAILVLDKAVVENTGHGDTGTGEVGVEVEAGLNNGARRRLLRVTSQKREDVVAATVAGLGDERKIRGQGTVVGGTAGLVVLVRAGDVVGKLAGALLDLTLVVGLSVVLVLLGKGLGLVDGHHSTDKRAPRDALEGVARGADLAVDLETATESGVVESLEELLVLPGVGSGVETASDAR